MSTPTIRRQLTQMVLFTVGAALLLAVVSMFAYDFLTFRQASQRQLETLGRAIAANSTAALAFDNPDDAQTVLAAFHFDEHITHAALYRLDGTLFAMYPSAAVAGDFPPQLQPDAGGFHFQRAALVGTLPVTEGRKRMGTLFVQSDLRAVYDRIRLYALIVALVVCAAGLLAYGLSRRLQQRITSPILDLAHTANAISTRHDYSVRATRGGALELDQLTDAFNHMLGAIQDSETRLHVQLGHLNLLQHITRAIGDRQDLASITQVVVTTLERSMPIQFGCAAQYDSTTRQLTISTIGAASHSYCTQLGLEVGSDIPLDERGLAAIIEGKLLHEPDTSRTDLALLQRLKTCGLGSVVIAPLIAEKTLFGVLIAARSAVNAFTSPDCEFLKQLSEHVALASRQAELNSALQMAYDDLQRTQQTTMQQERLRALGQIASGIAHDINNAISPIALYTESLLERETNLSEQARGQLLTIQRAIDDVAQTVARMREFYRPGEAEAQRADVELNLLVQQVIDLTRARWSDQPQRRGVMIELKSELAADLPNIRGVDNEIRDALTNLVFNAVDALPRGGVIEVRTSVLNGDPAQARVRLEVTDSGIGMDEETRRRCLEPFFTTKGERGTGLGLAMVYGMAQRHAAALEIDSQPGSGTTMRILFPIGLREASDTVRMPSLRVPSRSLRILIVDDDAALNESLRTTLQEDGHQVTAAPGGQEGIDAFKRARSSLVPFDVVITDLGMPYVDGRQVITEVRAIAPQTPIILLTGWGKGLDAEGEPPPEADRVLAKPPRMRELRAALAEVTAGRTAEQAGS
jgi:signal transduction histidine kinase/ActR/RegA family two-component response regulator